MIKRDRIQAVAGGILTTGEMLLALTILLCALPAARAEEISETMKSSPAYIPSATDLDGFRRSTRTLTDWFRLHLMLSRWIPYQIDQIRKRGGLMVGNVAVPKEEDERKKAPVQTASVTSGASINQQEGSVSAEGADGVRIGEPLSNQPVEVTGAFLRFNPGEVLINSTVVAGKPLVVVDAPITNGGDRNGPARLVAYVRPAGSDPGNSRPVVERYESELVEIPASNQSSGPYNGIRRVRVEIQGLAAGWYWVSVSAEGADGVRIGEPLSNQPVEVTGSDFAIRMFQMNSGGSSSVPLYTVGKQGDVYQVNVTPAHASRVWGKTEYYFDSGDKTVTIKVPALGPEDPVAGVDPVNFTYTTYTAAVNPGQYRQTLTLMRDSAQAAYGFFQTLSSQDPDHSKRDQIQIVIDALNRELS